MGEYARSLAIAQGIRVRWPGAAVHFILSRDASYAAAAPFPTTLLPSSPTFHSAAVIAVIESWHPDVVIFDNSGRTRQLRAASRSGAAVVYISARRRQRNKAFRLRWMRMVDEHWIAYPEFIAGSLGRVERLKLKLLARPVVRYLDVVLHVERARAQAPIVARWRLTPEEYVLVVPGGGTGHPGASDAVRQFAEAARGLAVAGVDTVFIGPAAAGSARDAPRLRTVTSLAQTDLADLMRGARLIVANGGSTLLQSIASGKPCIGVPVAADQPERIRRCVDAGAAVAAALDAPAIVAAAMALLNDASALDRLAGRAIALGLADGVEVAGRAIGALLAAQRR